MLCVDTWIMLVLLKYYPIVLLECCLKKFKCGNFFFFFLVRFNSLVSAIGLVRYSQNKLELCAEEVNKEINKLLTEGTIFFDKAVELGLT